MRQQLRNRYRSLSQEELDDRFELLRINMPPWVDKKDWCGLGKKLSNCVEACGCRPGAPIAEKDWPVYVAAGVEAEESSVRPNLGPEGLVLSQRPQEDGPRAGAGVQLGLHDYHEQRTTTSTMMPSSLVVHQQHGPR
ncbi:unnamed protein product, partial [Amoebophrya sp. A120]|eukprot:GSA120T00000384001.1